jgi:hypothetical protein
MPAGPSPDQPPPTGARLPRALERAARLAAMAVLAICALVLLAWAAGRPELITALPDLPPMAPLSALLLAAAASALWLRQSRYGARPFVLPLVRLLALGVTLAGGALLWAALRGHAAPFAIPLGAIPPTTAASLTLLGLALLLLDAPREPGVALGQLLALLASVNGARSMVGFVAAPESAYAIADRTGSALFSAVAATLLGVGVLCANPRPATRPMGPWRGPGGRVYRLLILPAVLVPVLVGALTIRGQQAGLFGVGLGVATQTLANLLLFWYLARALNRSKANAEREASRASAAQQVAERRMGRLRGLGDVDRAITRQPEQVGAIFDVLLEAVRGQLGVDVAAVLLLQGQRSQLTYTRTSGLRTLPYPLPADDPSYVARALATGQLMGRDDAPPPAHAASEGLVDGYAAPLLARGQVIGVLEVGHRSPLVVDAEWLQFLETLAGQGALAFAQFRLFADVQRTNDALVQAYDATLAGWSYALELRDGETRGHTERVTALTLKLAEACGISGEELTHIRRGALLHDIGKLGVPDAILLKPGPLTAAEWEVMRLHPVYAYQWLQPIAFLRPALAIPYCHHERWDGSGYPRGLRGAQIPLAARIFAVADVWDALRSERPYHPPWPADEVKAYIETQAGRMFDPEIVALFLDLVDGEEELRERAVGA